MKKFLIVIASVMLLVGLGFLLFAPVSNTIGSIRSNQSSDEVDKMKQEAVESIVTDDGEVITSLEEAKEAGSIDEEGYAVDPSGSRVVFKKDLDQLRADSRAYNRSIFQAQGTEETLQFEKAALDLSEYSVYCFAYGYVEADTINMRLPIFLGASDSMMAFGAGHLYGTSLPLGEENENCALAGHTGYIGRIFFDNLRKLSIGDEISVTNLWDTIDYTVIETKIVPKDYVNDILIEEGKTLLTLITCVSDGSGGFDRYLVICEKQ